MLNINIEQLEKACSNLYLLTGMKFVLWDSNKRVLYSYPNDFASFCDYVRTNKTLCQKCFESDAYGFSEVDKTRKICVYKCHMGLTEAIAPIIQNNIIIGYLMLGQVPEKESLCDIEEMIDRVQREHGLDRNELLAYLSAMKITDGEKLDAAANIMNMVSSYLWLNSILSVRKDTVFYQISEYINTNLDKGISVSDICKYACLSKTSLYNLSIENTGLGISDYIRKLRIEKAKNLLLSTDMRVSEIADNVGIKDSNYFIKVFRTETGTTPLKYRKSSP